MFLSFNEILYYMCVAKTIDQYVLAIKIMMICYIVEYLPIQ